MRILVVEDDKKIGSFVTRGLKEAGFVVDRAEDGESGLDLALAATYDAIIMDLMLPRLDGLSIVEELRRQKIYSPVIILSAKRSVDDRIKGLQHGGDDYLTKPFSFAELLARVHALIRRASHETEPTRLVQGELSLDLLTREITRSGKKIDLQPREFSLLEYLMRNTGRVVSKTMIIEHVWGYNFDPQTNVVDVLVSRLRNKVDRDFDKKLIHTHRGVGYAFKLS
ncbi:MAG: response regulator [Deltaproteobacteria bacterium]|nr:response regulator [Deltaproteobacteria bacterium]